MSLGPAVDVAIGLIFVYLTLGLVTTAFQELLADFLKSRGNLLRDAIAGLLAEGDKSAAMFQAVFGHALVQGTSTNKLPSYVASRNFTLALIDVLGKGGQAPIFTQVENAIVTMPIGFAKQSLTLLVREAAGDVDALKAGIARWYDDAMDRLSGEYKRRSHRFALGCGLVLAGLLNVNSLNIAAALWQSDALRARVATIAQVYTTDNPTPPSASDLQAALDQLARLDLPIGWGACTIPLNRPAPPPAAAPQSPTAGGPQSLPAVAEQSVPGNAPQLRPCTPGEESAQAWTKFWGLLLGNGLFGALLVLVGWAITGIATSLGAPFWFDLLKNMMNLRGAGPKPARADDPEKTTVK